jgi:hypothetical protein
MKNVILLSIFLFTLYSCNTSKNIVYNQTDTQIFFGNYGGFTNLKLEYVLNDDGNIFKIANDSTWFIKKIDRKQLKNIQNSIDENEFQKIPVNSPGNMTYFVRVKTKKDENRVIWTDVTPNKPVKIIYNKLFDLLKD